MTVAEILDRIGRYPARHVVLTGGEPLIAPDVEALTRQITQAGYHLTIETAATVWKDVVCDLASLSPKTSNSTPHDREAGRWVEKHESARLDATIVRRFMELGAYQLKFVIAIPDDLVEVDALLGELGEYEPTRVLLMPQGSTRDELADRGRWVAELCKDRGFRFCPRLHIELYGNTAGT